MYFKRLEIFGFKSFADKTVLNFEPGITAVIGPNGCGKSNIFDAIRWVLGEQSVKELRGASMEDVIFNGTDKKPGLGFAEVSLTFANEDRALPVDYNEVTVSRRLFRSGESEYLLNKTAVRLKDVLELFMGTGIGSEAYSLVQQGKVDLVVSAKPEDRRAILDEASGITKYKAKRREALNRLRDTENNLLRINDITIEVKRQISSLERQANKARRFKGEFDKLKTFEVKFARHQIESLEKEKQSLRKRVEELQEQEARAGEELRQLQNSLEQESSVLEDLEGKISEISAEGIKLDGQKDVCEKQIGFNEERLQNLALNEKRLIEKNGQLTERCRYQQDKIQEVREALESLIGAMEINQRSLQEKRSRLEEVTQTIQQSKEAIRAEEEKILDITSNQVQIKNRLTEVMKEGQGFLARKRRLEIENTKVVQEKRDVDHRLAGINQKIAEVVQRIEETREELHKRQELLLEKTARFNALEHSIDQLEKNRLFLRSQKEFIEKMTAQYQDIPDPIIEGRLLTNVKPQNHHTGIIGKVKNVRALSSEEFELLKAGFSQETKDLFEITCETKFIELDIQQIANRIADLDRDITEKMNCREQLLSELALQKKDVSQIELAIQEHEKTHSIHGAQKNDVLAEVKKLGDELDLLKFEMEDVTGSLTAMKINEDNLIRQLDSQNQELALAQLRIKEKQDVIAQQSQEREQTSVAVAQLETEAISLADKRKGLLENLQVFEEALETSQDEIAKIEDERRDLIHQREQFTLDIERIREKIVLLEEQKQSLQAVLTQHENQKKEIQLKMESLRAQLTQVADQLEQVRQTLHQEELSGQQFAFQEKEIKDRLLQTYRLDLDNYSPETEKPQEETNREGPPAETLEFPWEELPAAIEKLKKRCESFGSVNLVAIEEFESLRERFEFLTKQQSDLLTAKESLHETIRKINRQTRQMFMDTFTKVSEEFRIYYRMLFGGGDAQLVLLDPENVLESGIEIIARPPGKKLQNISLLSGGEKSLTAIALIFGVFKVNPSPFCVLDEIDAALDESNVGRFSFLLKDFAKIAQFIVITHNKKTIAIADVMYGITMQETGVSKIVSVKFAEQDKVKARNNEIPAAV